MWDPLNKFSYDLSAWEEVMVERYGSVEAGIDAVEDMLADAADLANDLYREG